jgi:hypothetical protein
MYWCARRGVHPDSTHQCSCTGNLCRPYHIHLFIKLVICILYNKIVIGIVLSWVLWVIFSKFSHLKGSVRSSEFVAKLDWCMCDLRTLLITEYRVLGPRPNSKGSTFQAQPLASVYQIKRQSTGEGERKEGYFFFFFFFWYGTSMPQKEAK